MMKKSPPKADERSRGNSPEESEQSAGTNIYKQAKSLFTKKFSLKLKQKDASPPKASEMSGAGKINKFKSSIPGKTTSISG